MAKRSNHNPAAAIVVNYEEENQMFHNGRNKRALNGNLVCPEQLRASLATSALSGCGQVVLIIGFRLLRVN